MTLASVLSGYEGRCSLAGDPGRPEGENVGGEAGGNLRMGIRREDGLDSSAARWEHSNILTAP